jgi:16S rRNA G1207 methylase RsmC
VTKRILQGFSFSDGETVLEPSCGDGRILDEIRKLRQRLICTGVEVDPSRIAQARAKGHHVHAGNFLQVAPNPTFNYVIMNPPFSGRHYRKHLDHAIKFLAPKGHLVCILPASAHYDHGDLPDGEWHDLPVGSFSESGTNVPTGYLTIYKRG